MPSSYVSGRVMSGQTEHSRAIIVGYVPSGHYFTTVWSLFHDSISDGQRPDPRRGRQTSEPSQAKYHVQDLTSETGSGASVVSRRAGAVTRSVRS
jgi:hypothetical protein